MALYMKVKIKPTTSPSIYQKFQIVLLEFRSPFNRDSPTLTSDFRKGPSLKY